MADITMCTNEMCTKKDTCYRYNAKPSIMQSYSYFVPVQDCYIGYNEEDYDNE